MKRRKFIKTLGISSLGLYLLPSFLTNHTSAFSPDINFYSPAVNRLHGSSNKGCSTSTLSSEFFGNIENGLDDWSTFRFTS